MFSSKLPLLPLVLDDVPWGLRQMLAQEGIPTASRDQRGSRGRFLLFDSRNGPCRRPLPGQTTIDIHRLRAAFDTDPFEQWNDHRSWRYEWQLDGLTPSEEICRVDKRDLRRRIMARLRRVVERRGGVWLAVSACPYPYRTAFNLRIDYDRYDCEDFDRLLHVLEGRQDAVSHFVNGAGYEGHLNALERLCGLDVGSHGYRHHTYQTCEENLRNIRRGIQVLEAARLRPVGFTAPHGRFNKPLLAALEHLEIGYSSEFAAGYDELPFLPSGSTVLQIPIHPVCLGTVLEAASTARVAERSAVEKAAEYFESIVEAKYGAGEPIFLYGHPTGKLGRHPELVEQIFEAADSHSDIWRVTTSEWASWWRVRNRVRLTVTREGDDLVIDLTQNAARYPLGIELHQGGQVARIPLDEYRMRLPLETIHYEERPKQAVFSPVRVDRPHGLRSRVRRWIDWEKETPVEEIAPSNWRNVAKRTLRNLWD